MATLHLCQLQDAPCKVRKTAPWYSDAEQVVGTSRSYCKKHPVQKTHHYNRHYRIFFDKPLQYFWELGTWKFSDLWAIVNCAVGYFMLYRLKNFCIIYIYYFLTHICCWWLLAGTRVKTISLIFTSACVKLRRLLYSYSCYWPLVMKFLIKVFYKI